MDTMKLTENLAGLIGLAENSGVDVNPTLLRALTDLYVQKRRHTEEEERHYCELALRLIDLVDLPTRANVAAKLAAHPAAPVAVIRRLARDVIAVAAPVLRQSPLLSDAERHAIAVELGQSYAAVIATREGAPTARKEPDAKPRPQLPPGGTATARELSALFFFANSAERRMILLNLDYASITTNARVRSAAPAAVDRLEMAALARLPDQFADELAQLLDISREQAWRLVRDEQGEPVVVAAKALEIPAPVLHRILLFLNPAVGESVERVFDLANLFEDITREAAEVMVTIWRGARATTAAHQPLHYDDDAGRALPAAAPSRPQVVPRTDRRSA